VALLFSDDFTRTDSSTIGNNWSEIVVADAYFVEGNALRINYSFSPQGLSWQQGHLLRPSGSSSPANGVIRAYFRSSVSANHGLICRWNATTGNQGHFYMAGYDGNNRIDIYRVQNTSAFLIAQSPTFTFPANALIKAEFSFQGTTLTCRWTNTSNGQTWTATGTDSNLSSGRVGFTAWEDFSNTKRWGGFEVFDDTTFPSGDAGSTFYPPTNPPVYSGFTSLIPNNGGSSPLQTHDFSFASGSGGTVYLEASRPSNAGRTYGRSWTVNADMSTPGGVIVAQPIRHSSASGVPNNGGCAGPYPQGRKIVCRTNSGNYKTYLIAADPDLDTNAASVIPFLPFVAFVSVFGETIIGCSDHRETASVGTINWSSVASFDFLFETYFTSNGTNIGTFGLGIAAFYCPRFQASGGEASAPINIRNILNAIRSAIGSPFNGNQTLVAQLRSTTTFQTGVSLRIGDDTNPVYCLETEALSVIFPTGVSQTEFNNRFCQVQTSDNWYVFRISPGHASSYIVFQKTISLSCDGGFNFFVDSFPTGATVQLPLSLYKATTLSIAKGSISGDFIACGELTTSGVTISQLSISEGVGTSGYLLNTADTAQSLSVFSCANGVRIAATGNYTGIAATFRNNTTSDVLISNTVASGTINLSSFVFAAGSTTPANIRYEGTGTITVVVNQSGLTTSTPNGGTVVLQAPVIGFNAPNFSDGTRVCLQRQDSFTVASTAINTTTEEITVTGNPFVATSFPTLIRFSLQGGATIPTSSPQIIDGGLYYCVFKSGDLIKISESEGGTPINFTSQGSGNFTILGLTEVAYDVVAGGTGYTKTLTLPNNQILNWKAIHWVADNGSGQCRSSLFKSGTVSWNSTIGASILDIVGQATAPDTFHNQFVDLNYIIRSDGSQYTLANSGASVSGLSFNVQGVVEINSNDVDGILAIQDAYLWYLYAVYNGGIRIANPGNFVIENVSSAVLNNAKLENISSTTPLQVIGSNIRRSDGQNPIVSTSYPIFLNADTSLIGGVLTTGISGLTPSESTALTTINTNVQDLHDFKGATTGNPVTANSTTGTVTTNNGKTITVSGTGDTRTYTRSG
jgi:hypothetical protein